MYGQWLRKICGWRLLNDNDLKLGGMGPLDSSMIPRSMNLVFPIIQEKDTCLIVFMQLC